jgi:signal transduction histidine kinase
VESLRFRVPAIFLAGITLAALVTGGFALQLFLDYNEDKTTSDLRRQAQGLADLYASQAIQSVDEGRASPRFAAPLLEEATGTRLYYAGVEIFPGQISGLRRLDRSVLDWEILEAGEMQTLQFKPPGTNRFYLAAAEPIELGGEAFGAIVVAKPRAELHNSFMALISRLGLAFLGGLVASLILVLYLSRSVTRPLGALSRAADQVAAGRYDAKLPRARSNDEIGHLTDRFREMTERLAESQRRERTFLMVVSHELRTPVTAIRGHIEALREGLAEDADARNASLDVIRTESNRLARLVGDVLDLARLDARQFTLEQDEVEMPRLLEQAYQAFSEEARRRGIEYERTFEAEPVIHTDGDRVLQIVSNLLGNAFSWTPDGGKIELTLAAGNGTVAVSVADSGPGIAREERERIFRPFYTRDGSGTGLGLPIARGLARALGGELGLQSELGRGSRFELRLPAS